MGYATRTATTERDDRYLKLKSDRDRIASLVQKWMDEATSLHGATTPTDEKAEIVALRDNFAQTLGNILGI